MDIKDINNNAAALFLNLRNGLSGASETVSGSGFANLLSQTSQVMDIVPAGADKNLPSQTPNAAVAEDKSSAASTKSEAEKAPADRKGKKAVAKPEKTAAGKSKTVQNKDEAPAAAVETAPNQVKMPADKPAAAQDAVEGLAPVSVDEAAPSPRTLHAAIIEQDGVSTGAMEGAFASQGIVGIMTDGTFAFADSAMTLEALAAMPEVKVLNAEGQVVTMTGAELAAQIQGNDGKTALPQIPFIEAVKQVEVPGDLVAEAARIFNQTASAPQNNSQSVSYADAELAAQAALLDEKAAPKHKLEVKVEVKEEKISSLADNGLIKDKVSLAEAVKAAAATEDGQAETSTSANQTATKPSAAPANSAAAAPVNSAPIKPAAELAAAFVAAAPTADNVETVATAARVSGATEINSSALARAGSTGSEFVNAARAETKAQADTSLRDVYKGMSKEVIDQVKVNITKSAVKGVDKIDVSLKPEELGHIEIKMQIAKDGKLHAHIIASRPETMEILQKEVQNLEKAFNDAGFSTDADSLSFSYNEGDQAGAQSDRNSDLRNFIGSVFANEAGADAAGNDNLYYWDPSKGLNIRV